MARAAPVETPTDPDELELWRSFFDTTKTSIQDALGYFQIDVDPTDDENLDGPEDDVVKYELFTLRPRQIEALDWVERYFWKLKNRAARIITLKCRRYGVSTFWLLFGLVMVLRTPGYQVLLVAQDDVSSRKHFQRLRDCFEQVPKWVLAERGIEVVKDTDSQLVLRHGGFKTAEFHVAPAKRNALGRGSRFNFILVTEFPHYPKAAKKDLSGILAACRNIRGNVIVFEATAKGHEQFQQRFARAEKRKSDYRAQFIAAFEHPGNRKPFADGAAEDEFIKSIGTVPEVGIDAELALFRRLTVDLKWLPHDAAEHLNWRRTEIMDVCEGILEVYFRENPNTPAEAFAGTGLPVFPKAILEAWRTAAEEREAKAQRGRLMRFGDELRFVQDFRGDLTIFEMPEPGETYAHGADVASGIAVHADGKTEADFSYVTIKNVRTKVTVARYRAHIEPEEFAEQVFWLSVFFNGARGYIERSINESGTTITAFEKLEIGAFMGPDLMLGQKVLIKTDTTNARSAWKWTPGHKTTGKTKPKLVANIRKELIALGLPDGVKVCILDVQFIDEGMKFERDDVTGRTEASDGHDDGVISEGLVLESIEVIIGEGIEEKPKEEELPKGGHGVLLRHVQRWAAERDAESAGADAIPNLPGY